MIAGGQSLGPMLNLRLAQPELLVDVRRIRELQRGTARRRAGWIVGSCVTHAAVEDGEVPDFTRGLHAKSGRGHRLPRGAETAARSGAACAMPTRPRDWVSALLLLSAVAVIEGPADAAKSTSTSS